MNRTNSILCLFFATLLQIGAPTGAHAQTQEPFRPRIHFSPKEKWMNDPNGLVYYQGTYHLFFQYYPGDIVWGPMHWGHAISKDLIHWQQQPIALYPDSLGYIFSGSAVVDSNNTTGFGRSGKIPLVAMFTHHDPAGEKAGSKTFQNESLAYSLDGGSSCTKYSGNPVLRNPGITDFRDPGVFWYGKGKKWIVALATKDRIGFYSSPDLKNWNKESEFGVGTGAHGGVWECPNLFPLNWGAKTFWVLLVSNNPGGPNAGSGTQYFIGQFDGHTFKSMDNATRWIDYGPDDYAGITWNNTGRRRIFMGWMSNWDYANQVPTATWRNAMTVPRDLYLIQAAGKMMLASRPSPELYGLARRKLSFRHIPVDSTIDLTSRLKDTTGRYVLELNGSANQSFALVLSDGRGDQVTIGYNRAKQEYYLDRSASGRTDFHPGFGGTYSAPRLTTAKDLSIRLVVDAASVEVFADEGLTVMTGIFFAQQPMTHVRINTTDRYIIDRLTFTGLAAIW